MKTNLVHEFLRVSLRQQAVFIPNVDTSIAFTQIKPTVSVLTANLGKLGYTVDEKLLHALNQTTPNFQLELLEHFREVMGVNKNWTPLVKGWDTPTGETITDHIMTFFANVFQAKGTVLACGHIIPANTFPLERYNGCPFCGTPFEFGKIENYGQGSKLKLLTLWTQTDVEAFFENLLSSKTALDATQVDSLKLLIRHLALPDVDIAIKETAMLVIDALVENDRTDEAQRFFKSPVDVMRYLWYKKTGLLQIIEPKTIYTRIGRNNQHIASKLFGESFDKSADAKTAAKAKLNLKYSRKEGKMVAKWLTNLTMPVEAICEAMHPKREMWIRFIRALRLAEYSKHKGFEKLNEILDVFYNEAYTVWQGRVNHYRLRTDVGKTMQLLKQRPGLFARSLFANMLWFGKEDTIAAFSEIIDKVPARLVFTLNMYADNYFSLHKNRTVKPLGGVAKNISNNKLLNLYSEEDLNDMKQAVSDLCVLAMEKRFAAQKTTSKTIFIDPILFNMPVSIGDRNQTIQDLPSALMGARFDIEGEVVRLFMQWGEGLPAQHLDMDLSCHVAYAHKSDICSFSRLVTTGCKHSGDIRAIPEKVGTAEYIDIDTKVLKDAGAKYVVFTSNAYSHGSLSPNMVVGWMNSKFPMKISEKTGVAYDPSCVQHQVRISRTLAKGIVFGVLDIEKHQIVWLELDFQGQIVQQLNIKGVESLLEKLDAKLSIGNLLLVKAKAQNLEIVETTTLENPADEAYTKEWAINTAAVTKLLVD